MATKTKITTTTALKSGLKKPVTLKQIRKLVDEKINPVSERIDRIVNAISKAKKVKGL